MSVKKKSSKLGVFWRRLFSTIILWGVIGYAIFSGSWPMICGVCFLLALICLLEFNNLFGADLSANLKYLNIFLCCGLYATYLSLNVLYSDFSGRDIFFLFLVVDVAFIILSLFFSTLLNLRKVHLEDQRRFLQILLNTFAFIYIPVLFSYVMKIFVLFGLEKGSYYLLIIVALSKFTDMWAYAVGVIVGRRKALPHISKGKTWEGFVGGVILCILSAIALRVALPEKLAIFSYTEIVILALLMALAAIVGDLLESIIKRARSIKDSGLIIPGIGGVFDLIDSVLIAAPIGFIFLFAKEFFFGTFS